jgi:hypothetical protein
MKKLLWLVLLAPLAGCPERTAEHLQISSPPVVEHTQVASRGRSAACDFGLQHHRPAHRRPRG